MSVYLQATISATPGKLPQLLELLKKELIPIMEAQGWRMAGCFTGISGPLNTIIDLWELEDLEHFRRGIKGFTEHPEFASIAARLSEWVQEEVLHFLEPVP